MDKINLLTLLATSEIGGTDIALLRLLQNLDKQKYRIVNLVPYPGPLVEEFRKSGIDTRIVDMPRLRRFGGIFMYIKYILAFFPTVMRVRKVIVDEKIDIVYTGTMANLYGAPAARLSGRPHVLRACENQGFFKLIARYFECISPRIIAISNSVKGLFIRNDVEVIPVGVDTGRFNTGIKPDRIRNELGLECPAISMVTRLAEWKGVDTFIKAAAHVKKNAKFVVFGGAVDGKEYVAESLKELTKTENVQDRIIFTDWKYKFNDVPEALAATDVFVHASTLPEPFGLNIVEAMSMGKAVVASGEGGPLDIIDDGKNGFLIKPGKPEELASKLNYLIDNPGIRVSVGREARKKALEKFDIQKEAAALDGVFEKLIKGRKRVLIVQNFGLGDVVMSLPFIKAVKRNLKNSEIHVLLDPYLTDFLKLADPDIKAIPSKRGFLNRIRLILDLRKMGFGAVYILNPLMKGCILAYFIGASERIGYPEDYGGFQKVFLPNFFLTKQVLPGERSLHDIEMYLDIARKSGLHVGEEDFSLKAGDCQRAHDFLKEHGIEDSDTVIGMNPNSRWISRCWEEGKFAALADRLIEKTKARVVFFAGPGEEQGVKNILSRIKHAGKTCVASGISVSELTELIRSCDIFITNESGPMHIAALFKVPTVALFGPGNISKHAYSHKDFIAIYKNAPCSPCALNYLYRKRCPDNVCMKNITVDEVYKEAQRLLKP